MTLDDILASAASALGFAEMVAMLLGGVMFGAFVIWLSPAISTGATSIRYVVMVFAIAGLVFFISRGSALFFDQSNLWPRNIGFSVLWVVYCIAMGCGLAVRKRRQA